MLHTLTMIDFKKELSNYLSKNNESIRGLCDRAAVSYATVSKFLVQPARNLRLDTYQKLLQAMESRPKESP